MSSIDVPIYKTAIVAWIFPPGFQLGKSG